jgi:alpha-L-rhamnosidase
MKSTIVSFVILILSFIDISHSLSDFIAHELKCEYLDNPLAIESSHPRLSWTLKEVDPKKQNLTQRAYQIVVASNKNLLNTNKGDLWDTNKVLSDKNIHIPYNGLKLNSRQISYWKVRVWDQNDNPSEFSAVARWQMGLIGPNDWTAQWIGAPKGIQENGTKNLLPVDSEVLTYFELTISLNSFINLCITFELIL